MFLNAKSSLLSVGNNFRSRVKLYTLLVGMEVASCDGEGRQFVTRYYNLLSESPHTFIRSDLTPGSV